MEDRIFINGKTGQVVPEGYPNSVEYVKAGSRKITKRYLDTLVTITDFRINEYKNAAKSLHGMFKREFQDVIKELEECKEFLIEDYKDVKEGGAE